MPEMFKPTPSQIGRSYAEDGTESGDEKFFKRDIGWDSVAEQQAFEAIKRENADRALKQVEYLSAAHPEITQTAYTQLVHLFPNDPRTTEWKKKT